MAEPRAQAGDTADRELAVFAEEAAELLQSLEDGLLRLERAPDDRGELSELFRAAHTLKGTSAMVGLAGMSEVTHVMEDFFSAVRDGQATISSAVTDTLLESVDMLKEMRRRFSVGEPVAEPPTAHLSLLRGLTGGAPPARRDAPELAALASALEASAAAQEVLRRARSAGHKAYSVCVEFEEPPDRAGVRCYQILNALEESAVAIESVPSKADLDHGAPVQRFAALVAAGVGKGELRAAVSAVTGVRSVAIRAWRRPPPGEEPPRTEFAVSPEAQARRTMRVDLERLDGLMNTVGELVVDRTRMGELARVLQRKYERDAVVQELCGTSAHLFRLVDELNDAMSQVRMVPISTLFATFPRMVRDLARNTAKVVEFRLEGEETELDRGVINEIKDAVIHLLRNAVDHGIEGPAERQAAGKPEAGTVLVAARHEQGRIVVSVEDDGSGIDAALVSARAVDRGLVTQQAAERMSDGDIWDLLFEPGFSTSERVTETSGRGVGMDVVRRSVSAVGGLVELQSVHGSGTTVTLRLPLTLATFQGLLVRVGEALFAIPVSYVQETAKLDRQGVSTVLGAEVLRLRGGTVPLVRMSELYGDGGASSNTPGGAVVVVRAGERPLALGVDELLAQRDVVAKPLQAMESCEGIAGTSVLGDGTVALILDTPALIAKVSRERGRAAR